MRPAQSAGALVGVGVVSRVEVARVDAQHRGHLFDDHVVDQRCELAGVCGARLNRSSVDDDAWVHLALRREQATEWHVGGLPRGGVAGGYVIDRELDLTKGFSGPLL